MKPAFNDEHSIAPASTFSECIEAATAITNANIKLIFMIISSKEWNNMRTAQTIM